MKTSPPPTKGIYNTTMVVRAAAAYWRPWCAALLLGGALLLGAPTPCLGVSRDLGLTGDFVAAGGSCEGGCVRTVVDAVAISLGEVDCDPPLGGLRVENLLDHTKEDVMGGALNVVHYCSDAEGELVYQARREFWIFFARLASTHTGSSHCKNRHGPRSLIQQ